MCAHVYIKTMTYFLVVHAGMKVANIAKARQIETH